jgi:hypothetical protein
MAFLPGVPCLLPVHTVHCVQPLQGNNPMSRLSEEDYGKEVKRKNMKRAPSSSSK